MHVLILFFRVGYVVFSECFWCSLQMHLLGILHLFIKLLHYGGLAVAHTAETFPEKNTKISKLPVFKSYLQNSK